MFCILYSGYKIIKTKHVSKEKFLNFIIPKNRQFHEQNRIEQIQNTNLNFNFKLSRLEILNYS